MKDLNEFFKSVREFFKSVRVFWVAIGLSVLASILIIATGSDRFWQLYLGFNVILFLILAIFFYSWKVATGKKVIEAANDEILTLDRGFRKQQKNYDSLRRKLMEARSKLKNKRQSKESPEGKKPDPAEITKLEKEITKLEKQVEECQTDLEKFNEEVMEAYREGGIITNEANKKFKTEGFRKLKEDKREAEEDYIKKGLFSVIISGVLVIISALLLLVSFLEKTEWVFGPYTLIVLIFCGTAGIFYLLLSIRMVGKTEKGIKFFMGMPYREVDRGPHLVAWGLGSLVKLPLAVQYYDMVPENVIITGDESQSIEVDTSIAYHFHKIWDVVTELGTSKQEIKEKLEERTSGDGSPKLMLGIIGDKVASFIRAYVASGISGLEEALTMRDGLSEELSQILKDDLQYLGIKFQRVVVRGVKPTPAMVTALDQKAIAKVEIDKEAFKAKGVIKKAEGEKQAIILKGQGEAEVTKVKILAEFQAKIEALNSITSNDMKNVMPYLKALVYGEKPLAEVTKALQGMKINLFAVPGIDKILNFLGLGNKA